jgi:hypothetical protein
MVNYYYEIWIITSTNRGVFIKNFSKRSNTIFDQDLDFGSALLSFMLNASTPVSSLKRVVGKLRKIAIHVYMIYNSLQSSVLLTMQCSMGMEDQNAQCF